MNDVSSRRKQQRFAPSTGLQALVGFVALRVITHEMLLLSELGRRFGRIDQAYAREDVAPIRH